MAHLVVEICYEVERDRVLKTILKSSKSHMGWIGGCKGSESSKQTKKGLTFAGEHNLKHGVIKMKHRVTEDTEWLVSLAVHVR